MTNKLEPIQITEVTGIKCNPLQRSQKMYMDISSKTKDKLRALKEKWYPMTKVLSAWTNYILSLNEEEFLDIYEKFIN